MSWLLPGPVHTLKAGPLTLTVTPAAGGRLASLTWTGDDGQVIDWLAPMSPEALRDGFDAEAWPKAGCYPLLPFSNRIRDGRFLWEGREVVLLPHQGQAHAMHGLGHVRSWHVTRRTVDAMTLQLRHIPAGDDWPWPLSASQTLTLTPDGLSAELVLRNDGDSIMPAGAGFHPFFARPPGLRVQFDAVHLWQASDDGLATARTAVSEKESFLRERNLPEGDCNGYYGGWRRQATLKRADGHALVMRAGEGLEHLVLHAPAGRDYVCLEPVSHVADAINLSARGWEGTGLRTLAPDESLRLRMQWRIDTP